MPKLSPQQHAQRWQSAVANAGEKYKAGVQGVQGNPASMAIAAKERWIAALNQAAADGRFEAGLSGVTEASWKQSCVEKGAAALAAGARLGAAKVEKFEREFGPTRDAIVNGLPARGTADQNDQRMLQFVQQMRASRRRR